MKIEEHVLAWRWTLKVLTSDAAEVRGRNLNAWRNLIGIRTKNFPRDAIIANALQAALDTPLNDPD
jgi:hypothetical protein